jgi:hypothetical protein
MVRFESKELTNNCLNLAAVMPNSLTFKLKAIVDLHEVEPSKSDKV